MAPERLEANATAALVSRAQSGDREAFARLARAYLRAAYAVALAVVGRPADAEDIAQDALLSAFTKLDTCREPAKFRAWLLGVVRHRALNWLDSRRLRDVPRHEVVAIPGAVDPPATDPGMRERVAAALTLLTPTRREVVLLHDLDDWTHAEIGAALGMSEVMSRQHLFQARRQLRAELRADALLEERS
ncbi:MAG: RNA polymerase sigma factor [Proteobacteria bacterium]|nr:RNA polymerase sigma factor [Pseudomonadota bacterium]